MKLHIVPARTGIQWVKLSIQTFRRQPMALTALFFLCCVAVSVVSLLPIVGAFLHFIIMPAMLLAMMLGSAEAVHNRTPRPLQTILGIFRTGKQQTQSLLILGAFYAVSMVLIIGFTSLFDDGTFARLSLGQESLTPEMAMELVEQPGFQAALWSGLGLNAFLGLLILHAPALVHWHHLSPGKAIFFSLVACLRNLPAFFVYLLSWIGLTIAAGIVLSLLTQLLAAVLGNTVVIIANILTIMLVMSLLTMFFSSTVFAFRDCFSPPSETDEA